MDFESAIHSHLEWKTKLREYIKRPDHSINAETVSRDDQCEFGKWLMNEGKNFKESALFKELIQEHTKFHLAAGDVIKRANLGQKVAEEVFIGSKSEFGQHAQKVVSLLLACKKEHQD